MKSVIILLFSIGLSLGACNSDSGGGDGGGMGGGPGANGGKGAATGIGFDGQWKGTGQIVAQGQTINCGDVVFEFRQTTNTLKVNRGDYTCDQGTSYNWETEEVNIEGNNLKANGQTIGTFDGSVLDINNGNYSLKMQRNGNQMSITEITNDPQQGQVQITATLTKQ